MTRELEGIFQELGLAQYLDAFVDQGFDTWDTILDIQESDLDALGVKLGHRRKLQRKIANARGIAPSISLASPAKSSHDDAKVDGNRSDHGRADSNADGSGVTKRKYRRHPKPDDNAPERPPSAYVLFSNKMREDLKSHNLTFTEIAKLVGENWQSLPPAEKEAYEGQANAAKEKYHRDLTDYKKTPEYRKYALYLQDFKEKQAKQNQDASKRAKVEPARLRHGSTSSSATPATSGSSRSGSGSGSRSGSERMQGSEPPPNRPDGLNSTMIPDGHFPATGTSRVPPPLPMEDSRVSPRTGSFEPSGLRHRQEHSRGRESGHQHLPSLSDMLDDGRPGLPGNALDGKPFITGLGPTNQRRTGTDGPSLPFVPAFKHEESSNGSSTTSGSTSSGFGRPSSDGPLPIHALLSNRGVGGPGSATYSQSSSPTFSNAGSTIEGKPPFGHRHGPQGYGFQSASSALEPMKVEQLGDGDILMTSVDSAPQPPSRSGKDGLDGMSALLRAGELVSRHDRR